MIISTRRRAPFLASPAFVLSLLAIGLAASPATARDVRACQALEQRYLQIKAAASSAERNSLLFSTSKQDCASLATQLLTDGASVDARDRLGNMPLAMAASHGHVEIVKQLLEFKAPVNARNLEASSALFLATENEHRVAADVLLAAGADPNIPGRSGLSAISAAAYTGNAELVALLLAKGANPKALDATGKSAIVYAAGRGFAPVVKLILDHGIDVNARLASDLTVLMWAAGHSDEAGAADVKETIELLTARGARVDDVDDRGRTALMTAAVLGRTTAAETLVKAGADVSLKDKSGKSAADLASDDAMLSVLASAK